MTTIIAVIFTVVATYAAGIIAFYVSHRMSHVPFHLDVFGIIFFCAACKRLMIPYYRQTLSLDQG